MSPPLPNSPTDVLSRRLPEVRKAHQLSQAALAAHLRDAHEVDIDRPQIANLEAGRRQSATIETVVALALALDVSPDVLVLPADNSKVALTPQVVVSADTARSWFAGRGLLVAAADADAETSWPPEGVQNATDRIEFWRSQRPDWERRARTRPGVDHLLSAVDWFMRGAGRVGEGSQEAMREALESIRREVARALDELDRADAEGETG